MIAIGAAVAVSMTSLARAADIAWGSSSGGDFTVGSNWVGGVAPSSSSDWAFFSNDTLDNGTITMGSNTSIEGMTMDNTSGTLTFNLGASTTYSLSLYLIMGDDTTTPLENMGLDLTSGTMTSNLALIGNDPNSTATVVVSGTGSAFNASGSIRVGSDSGSNSVMTLEDGAQSTSAALWVGLQTATGCVLTVTDPGTKMAISGAAQVAGANEGGFTGGNDQIKVLNGGELDLGQLLIGVGDTTPVTNDAVTVSGTNSLLKVSANNGGSTTAVYVGYHYSNNQLNIENGASFTTTHGNVIIGGNASSSNNVLDIDDGTASIAGGIYVGGNTTGALGSGEVTISDNSQVTIGGTLEVYNTSGSNVTQSSGSLTAGNTVNSASISVTGGTANLGPVTGTGTLDIGGTPASVTASGLQQSTVNISAGGRLKLTAGGGSNAVSSLVLNGNSVLDLTTTSLLINYGSGSDPIAAISGALKTGYNGGSWNGPGINSSAAAAQDSVAGNLKYGVGWSDGADQINGHPIVSGLSSGQIELKYTLLGDANLDGTVNGSDFSILAANFGQGYSNWDQGNFLFTPAVNGTDFSALAANFGQGDSGTTVAVSAQDWAALDAFAAANGLQVNVPEPASAAIFALAGFGIMNRKRRDAR